MRHRHRLSRMTRKFNCTRQWEFSHGNKRASRSDSRRFGNITIALKDIDDVDGEELNQIPFHIDGTEWDRMRLKRDDQEPDERPIPPLIVSQEEYVANGENRTSPSHESHIARDIQSILYTIASEKCIRMTSSENVGSANNDDTISTTAQASDVTNKGYHCSEWLTSGTHLSHDEELQEMKLKNLCGELLVELCKVTAGTRTHNFKTGNGTITITSSSADKTTETSGHYKTDYDCSSSGKNWSSYETVQYCQKCTVNPIAGRRRNIKTITFRPLVCTKLSVPWRQRRATYGYVKKRTFSQATTKSKKYGSGATVSTSTQVDGFENDTPTSHDKAVCVRSKRRRYATSVKPKKQDYPLDERRRDKTGDARKEFKKPSTRSRHRFGKRKHTLRCRHNSNKMAKKLIHFWKAPSKDNTTKHYMKHYNPSTSDELKTKTETESSASKQRRKINTFTLPSSNSATLTIYNHRNDGKRKRNRVDNDETSVETISRELGIIDSHVKAHAKNARDLSVPVFNNCFRRILSRELRPPRQPVEESSSRRTTRVPNDEQPPKMKKEGLFSCLIPRAFNKSLNGK